MKTLSILNLIATITLTPALLSAQEFRAVLNPTEIAELIGMEQNASMEEDEAGDPMIATSYNGQDYWILFYYCNEEGDQCEDMHFGTYWLTDNSVSLEQANAWNRDYRFAKAFIDGDGDANLEMNVDYTHGYTVEGFVAVMNIWHDSIDTFEAEYITSN